MEQDIIIKFCVVGEPSVGKTSMLYQYVHHKFDEKVRPTIGCDFSTKLKSSVDGKPVRLQLWDIAGQERFNSVSKMYLRGALGTPFSTQAVSSSAPPQMLPPSRKPSSGRASSRKTQRPAETLTSLACWSKISPISSIPSHRNPTRPRNTSTNLRRLTGSALPCSARQSRTRTLRRSSSRCSVSLYLCR